MKKRFSIVGQKYLKEDPYLTGILPGTPVVLVRDPSNQHDKNAVAVFIDGKQVGFLTMGDNPPIAALIDKTGEPFVMKLAQDSADGELRKTMNATFARSPNSAYPQVEVEIDG